MQNPIISVLVVLCLMNGSSFAEVPAEQHKQCADTDVRVSGLSIDDTNMACSAAKLAVLFMEEQGVHYQKTLKIAKMQYPVKENKDIARYNARTNVIEILPSENFLRVTQDEPAFSIPTSPALYRSVVVHEIAHAIALANTKVDSVPRISLEYISYTAQLATMAPDLRQTILARYPVPAFASESEISEIYYLMDPHRFAVKSYLHFIKPENGANFYKRLLDGSFLPANDMFFD